MGVVTSVRGRSIASECTAHILRKKRLCRRRADAAGRERGNQRGFEPVHMLRRNGRDDLTADAAEHFRRSELGIADSVAPGLRMRLRHARRSRGEGERDDAIAGTCQCVGMRELDLRCGGCRENSRRMRSSSTV